MTTDHDHEPPAPAPDLTTLDDVTLADLQALVDRHADRLLGELTQLVELVLESTGHGGLDVDKVSDWVASIDPELFEKPG